MPSFWLCHLHVNCSYYNLLGDEFLFANLQGITPFLLLLFSEQSNLCTVIE